MTLTMSGSLGNIRVCKVQAQRRQSLAEPPSVFISESMCGVHSTGCKQHLQDCLSPLPPPPPPHSPPSLFFLPSPYLAPSFLATRRLISLSANHETRLANISETSQTKIAVRYSLTHSGQSSRPPDRDLVRVAPSWTMVFAWPVSEAASSYFGR